MPFFLARSAWVDCFGLDRHCLAGTKKSKARAYTYKWRRETKRACNTQILPQTDPGILTSTAAAKGSEQSPIYNGIWASSDSELPTCVCSWKVYLSRNDELQGLSGNELVGHGPKSLDFHISVTISSNGIRWLPLIFRLEGKPVSFTIPVPLDYVQILDVFIFPHPSTLELYLFSPKFPPNLITFKKN